MLMEDRVFEGHTVSRPRETVPTNLLMLIGHAIAKYAVFSENVR